MVKILAKNFLVLLMNAVSVNFPLTFKCSKIWRRQKNRLIRQVIQFSLF